MIRISDRYIGKQVMMFTLYAVIVLCFVLVLGNLFKTIQDMLVDQKAPLSLVLRFIGSVLPASLMYTLPWGFLSAVLIVFGRMSSHQEITCFRVSGMSLPRLSAPVFIMGAALSVVCLWLNVEFVPNAKASMKELLYDQATRDPNSMLKPGVAQGSFTNDAGATQKLLIEGRDGHWVQGFHFYELGSEGEESKYIHATQAALSVDHASNQLKIKLDNAYIETRKPGKRVPTQIFAGHAEPLVIDLEERRSFKNKPSSMTNGEIRQALKRSDEEVPAAKKTELRMTMTKRYSFSMACMAFAFIAVPLGLSSRRAETSRGLIISLMIAVAYFLTMEMSEQIKDPRVATVMLWVPNLICIGLGFWLFLKARFK